VILEVGWRTGGRRGVSCPETRTVGGVVLLSRSEGDEAEEEGRQVNHGRCCESEIGGEIGCIPRPVCRSVVSISIQYKKI